MATMIKHETQARHHPVPKGSTSCKTHDTDAGECNTHDTDAGESIDSKEQEEKPRDPRKRVRPLITRTSSSACSDILMDPDI